MTVKPWYSLCTPHKDIRDGKLDEAKFAVDLWAVVNGNGPEVYLDPEEFFNKTYQTEGLKKVIEKTVRGLNGDLDSGNRILSLQTTFGGGKTHLLLTLYHLCKAGGKVPAVINVLKQLGVQLPGEKINLAVFTNMSCDATQGRTLPDGTKINTIWGDIAFQLGGKELYSIIEANDKARSVPQGLFEKVLAKAAPCLILIDELTDYCVGASSVKVGDSTMENQTISFVSQLTTAINQVPGSVLVATLPASDPSVAGGQQGLDILDQLEARFGRMAADQKPVQDEEIFAVVRKRLFDSIADENEIKGVAKAYFEMYSEHQSEVPSEASRATYRDKIERAYPFHPELIEALYLRWGSHHDFQRTRGVLRLLGTLVADLWIRRNSSTQSQALIQPRNVRWSLDAWSANLTRLWGNGYEAVIASDITGANSNSFLLDKERGGDYEREAISEGVASALLLNSFGAQPDRAGLNEKEIKLACAHPGVNWNYVDGALVGLERSFYLHATSGTDKRYWYNTKPTINQLIVRYRMSLSDKSFNSQIEEYLRKQAGSLQAVWKILVNPGKDLSEQKVLTLVLFPPSIAWSEDDAARREAEEAVLKLSRNCGSKERLFRNTLVFLLPTVAGARALQNAFREVATLESVLKDFGTQLDAEQKSDLRQKIESAKKTADETFSSAYTVLARVQKDEIEWETVTEPRSTLGTYFAALWHRVLDVEWVHQKIGMVAFEQAGMIPKDQPLRVKDAVESFLRYTDKPMIPSAQVVHAAIQAAVKDGRVGLGQGTTASNLQKKWCGESVSLAWEEEGLWIIPPFEKEPVPDPADPIRPGSSSPIILPTNAPAVNEPAAPVAKTFKRITVHGSVPIESWAELFRCFIQPSIQMNLKKQKLSIQFDFESRETSPIPDDNRLAAMKEAASQLGLEMEVE